MRMLELMTALALSPLDRLALRVSRRVHQRAHWLKNLFQAGFNKGVSFQPTGGVNTAINITKWDWEEQIEKIDISHTGTAGLQALLAGLLRGTGNVEAFFDSANLPWAAAPSIKSGQNGVITFNLGSPNTQWIVPSLVVKVHAQSEVAGGVKYNFDVELNCLCGVNQAFTSYVYPT
jgi:hypothetical protein